MAQTGYTPILIYSSSTTTNAPSAGNLTNSTLGSELAINITDGKLFYKDNANAVQVIAWKTTPTTAGGTGLTSYTAGDLLYYASGTTLTKLGIGSAYQALQVNAGGTAPSWQASATSTLTAQGDLLYASAANTLARLAKNTSATRYLSNTGSSNNPAWAQVDLTNGVTGVLPNANTTGATAATANTLLLRDGSGNGTVATLNCSAVSNSGSYQQAYGQALNSTTSGGSTSHMMSYQTWSGNANTLVVGNTFGDVVFGTGGGTLSEKARLFTSGGFSLGNTTDPGAGNLNVNGPTLKVGTTSLYNSSANIGTFSWSSATNVGGEGAYVFVNTSSSANSDPNPILAIHKGSTTTSSSARFIQFFANGAAQAMGGIVGNGATNVQFVSLSDEREKENIQPVVGALDRLMQIQVCSFDRKGGGDHVKAGFIAQNVLPVYPEYVVENAANADDEPRYGITGGMSAGYVAELTAAIQEQQTIINDLKQKLEQYIAKN